MVETQESISKWIKQTFGEARSNSRIVARANEEMAELLSYSTSNDNHEKIAEEIADIFIVLYEVATNVGVDIHKEVNQKMEVNRARKWKLDNTGCGQHIEEGEYIPPSGGVEKVIGEPETCNLYKLALDEYMKNPPQIQLYPPTKFTPIPLQMHMHFLVDYEAKLMGLFPPESLTEEQRDFLYGPIGIVKDYELQTGVERIDSVEKQRLDKQCKEGIHNFETNDEYTFICSNCGKIV